MTISRPPAPRALRARRLRSVLLALACVCTVWSAWLLAFGGFTVSVFGRRIRSHEAWRVALVAIAAVLGYVLAGGTIPVRPAVARLRRLPALVAVHPLFAAIVLAAAVTMVGIFCGTRVAGGSDAYGYVSQADLWLKGDLHVKQPWVADVPWPDREWTFTPLGYRPAPGAATPSLVPTYSAGLPLILASAKAIGGQCALFAVVPVMGGLAILFAYGIGQRIGSPWVGVAAGWLLGTSPAMLGILMEPMTDVPVMTAWTASIYFLLGNSTTSALRAGLCAAVAILIRPNLVLLAAPLFLWLVVQPHAGRTRLIRAPLFAVAALIGIVAVASINRSLYGSPFISGYGRLEDQFAWIHVAPNLRRYFTWLVETETPLALLGFVALVTPSRRMWPGLRDRRILVMFTAFVALLWGEYAGYLEFDSWGYLRFLLPSWPLLMVGLSAALAAVGRAALPGARLLAFACVAGLGFWTLHIAEQRGVFNQRQAARHEAIIGDIVREHTGPRSVVFAWGRSGSLRYYAGRVTARYDLMKRDWLDRAIAWMTNRGVHVYVLLDENELPEFRQRFAGQSAGILTRPVLVYEPAGIDLFDLSNPPEPGLTPLVITTVPAEAELCKSRAEGNPLRFQTVR
jgi:hypothetical protein